MKNNILKIVSRSITFKNISEKFMFEKQLYSV